MGEQNITPGSKAAKTEYSDAKRKRWFSQTPCGRASY